MADKTVADLPKKNAAPAEPAKSLQATVQQVMNKAITSPTDAKVDFAQGVNHITGDPQQKSAGPADAMQSLKAEADPKKTSYSNANEAEEKKDKEKEDMKEVADKEDEKKKDEMMKASKDKEDMKEGEMPAGLKKYLDKKNGKEEEADKEKKDVKEVADKEKEMKKEMSDKEKKDMKEVADKEKEMKKDEMMKASKDKEDMKEVADKEDEKKKEVSEVADKEKEAKKEMTAKDKVKDMDMKEDVAALTDGEDLSEEFKQKASTIFEAAVKAKLVEEIEKLEGEYETKVAEKVEETKSEIVEKVDAYLNYVVEEWMKENELAIEKGLRAEITEDFIGGLKSLFESHYINVPQEKYDVIEAQTAEIEKLKEEVNQTIEKNVELNQAIGQHVRQDIINDVSSDLAETESEKLKGLAESIEYKDAESFRTSVETLKNSYFPKAKASETESNEVAEQNAGADLSESMAAYTAAISKSKKNPYLK
tara:strand:+ start:622 stop:2058 length:1437 start_codon:yes stop_codon:yes gene_type:complete